MTKQTPINSQPTCLRASFVILIGFACAIATAAGPVQADAKAPGSFHSRTGVTPQQEPAANASVLGGEPATQGTFPWMAFVLDIRGEGARACSGTVVAPNLVLTAGHCAVDMNTGVTKEAADYSVVTGVVDWANPEREVSDVSRVLVYPHMRIYGYYDEGWGDAALLMLSTPTTAPAVPLATSTDAKLSRGGTHALVAGWGSTKFQQKQPTEQLMWGKTVVQSPRWCKQHASPFNAEKQICTIDAPSLRSGTCFGDSGGPLLATGPSGQGLIEIGITSEGVLPHCSTRGPRILTRAGLISPWVNRWIAALDPSPSAAPQREPGVPKLDNPMTEADVVQTLIRAFGNSFKRTDYTLVMHCSAIDSKRRTCSVRWSSRVNDYFGAVFVSLPRHGDGRWRARYKVSWVNNHCYFHTNHPNRCPVHMRHRRSLRSY